MPRLSLVLSKLNRSIEVSGLLDTGASMNVLPYDAGLALGARWEDQKVLGNLTGNLAHFEARGLRVLATHPQLTPGDAVELVFAWTQARNAPVLFGQVNFFAKFDVCFYGAKAFFDINPK